MNIEEQLKKINNYEVKFSDSNFKENLRKRLLNEYSEIIASAEVSSPSLSLIDSIKNKIGVLGVQVSQGVINTLKYQSALNLSVIFLFIFSFTAIASYFVIPVDLKENLFGKKADLDIIASVEGANVYVNGEFVGTTPLENYKLPKGNYSIRVEKDGYQIYTESVDLSNDADNKVNVDLKVDREKVYAQWLEYKNSDLNFSFNYPSDWKIKEELGSEDGKNYQISLTNNGSKINLIVNPENKFDLNKSADVSSYEREIKLAGNVDTKRYLQFNNEGSFVNGGVWIDGQDQHPDVYIQYFFDGKEEEILASESLKSMDKIAQSLIVDNLEYVVALDETDQNKKVDLSESTEEVKEQEDSENTATVISKPTEEVKNEIVLSQSYVNKVYGYQISYPSGWELSVSRASYPFADRGYFVEADGNELEVARLKLKSKDGEARLYLLSTTENVSNLDDNSQGCGKGYVVSTFGAYSLTQVEDNNVNDYQVCKGNSGTFEFNSALNGVVKYSLYLNIDDEDITSNTSNEVKKVINSLRFSDALVENRLKDSIEEYSNAEIGIKFTYPSSWKIEETGGGIKVSKNGKMYLSTSNLVIDDSEYESVSSREIPTLSGVLSFLEYSNENNEFIMGVYESDKYSIMYYAQPQNNQELMNLISSMQLL